MADLIYKFGPFDGNYPLGYRGDPVHLGIHEDGNIYLWCRIPLDCESAYGTAVLVCTGEKYTGRYIGTVITRTGFVFHAIAV